MVNPKLKYLEDVQWDNSLKLSNGKTVHDLEQLPMVIKYSDDEVFYSHVTNEKNDFANWIRDVIGDGELADRLLSIRTKEDFLKFMEQAITDIKNYKEPEPAPQTIVQPIPVSPVVQPVQQTIVVPVIQPAQSIVAAIPQVVVQSVQQPVVPPIPQSVVQTAVPPNVQPIIQSTTQSAPQPVIVSSPNSQTVITSQPDLHQPVISPVVYSASQPVTSSAVLPLISPIVEKSAVVSPVVSSDKAVSSPETVPAPAVEETFEYEEIFKVLINELEQEVLSWDTTTS
jgi:hypothetical protein